MTDWQPIDTAKKIQGKWILLADEKVVTAGFWDAPYSCAPMRWIGSNGYFSVEGCQPTHWMPLPQPPETGETP